MEKFPEPGQVLSHYRLLEPLGRGGMGVVWRAYDEKLRRDVALKLLPPELLGDADRRRRFIREARTAASVNHPNIATIYEGGEAEGQPFLAMELVEGPTLRSLLNSSNPLPAGEALRITISIAEGLAEAHERNVVHRDLKPDNVIVGRKGKVKVLDFGLAKVLRDEAITVSDADAAPTFTGDLTTVGKVMGTTKYMSPEQARGQDVDGRSDIFSLGATLYELLTGRPPFSGRTTMDVLAAILSEPVPSASERNSEVGPEIDAVVARCLQKDPSERYQSAEELLEDLRAVAGPEPSGTSDHGSIRHAQVGVVPSRTAWIVGSLLVGLALVVAMLLTGDRLRRWIGSGADEVSRLAVLPIRNLSGDASQDLLADGMTEVLIANLARIGSLDVISRTSVMAYKGSSLPLPEIARQLRVHAVIEGSVLQVGDRVRITAQLFDASTEENLWGNQYNRELRDILVVQSEVAGAIAREIRVSLTPQEEAQLKSAPEVNPEVYQLYLQGRHRASKLEKEGLQEALDLFQRAIAIDPDYAPAYAGMAEVYYGFNNLYWPPDQAMPKMKFAAETALRLDDTLSAAHVSYGQAIAVYEFDLIGATRSMERAIELNPSNADARLWRAILLTTLNRIDAAAAELDKARELDPLSEMISVYGALPLYMGRRFEDARNRLRRVIESDPDHYLSHAFLGLVNEQLGDLPGAIDELKAASELADTVEALAQLGHMYALAGRTGDALRVLNDLGQISEGQYLSPFNLALIRLALGETDLALDLLWQAYEERSEWCLFMAVDPRLDGLRDDPRFVEILERLGLPRQIQEAESFQVAAASMADDPATEAP